jgi:hypothetical protein
MLNSWLQEFMLDVQPIPCGRYTKQYGPAVHIHTDSHPKRPVRSLQKKHTAFLRMELLGWYNDGLSVGRSVFDFRMGQDFCLILSLQAGSGVHKNYYPMGTEGGFCLIKGAEAGRRPLGSI